MPPVPPGIAKIQSSFSKSSPVPVSAPAETPVRAGMPIQAPQRPAVVNIPSNEFRARQKYNPEIAQKIVSVVQAGNTREVACASAGISNAVLSVWARLALEGEEPFMSFMDQLDKAEASLEAVLVAIIRQKAQDDPNVAFRLLERRFPQRWAPGATPAVNINLAQQNQMTPADARAVMRDLFGDLSPKKVIEAPSAPEPTGEEK